MIRSDREPRRGAQPETERDPEHVVHAMEIDMVEVARRTDGSVSFDDQEPYEVTWNGGTISLSFRDNDSERVLILNRQVSDQIEINVSELGLVMGLDYIALVYPYANIDGQLEAEIIKHRNIIPHIFSENDVNPLFREARDLARTLDQDLPTTSS